MLEVEDLAKYYGGHAAVAGIRFAVAPGQVIGLLGLNGAGKTTLLRMLAAVLRPDRGHVRLGGQRLGPGDEALRARIGFLPETTPVHADMQVGDFLAFVDRLRGGTAAAASDRVAHALAATQLTAARGRTIATLSHGTRRRVGLAQAIVHQPELLLLDEPTAGLDPVQMVQMRALVRDRRGQGTTLISSHQLAEVSELGCDRILLLHQGALAAEGTEAELAARVHQGVTLRVVARGPAEALVAALASLHGDIEVAVDRHHDGVVEATLRMRADHSERVAAAIVGAGLGLRHLERRQVALEGIFLALAQAPAPGAEVAP